MKREFTEQERRWVETWKETGKFLQDLRLKELRSLSEAESALHARQLLKIYPGMQLNPANRTTSGLFELQRHFAIWKKSKTLSKPL